MKRETHTQIFIFRNRLTGLWRQKSKICGEGRQAGDRGQSPKAAAGRRPLLRAGQAFSYTGLQLTGRGPPPLGRRAAGLRVHPFRCSSHPKNTSTEACRTALDQTCGTCGPSAGLFLWGDSLPEHPGFPPGECGRRSLRLLPGSLFSQLSSGKGTFSHHNF